MKRLIVRFPDGGFCNLPVTRVELRNEDMIYGWNGEALAGVFDLGSVDAAYVTEEKA